MFLQSLFRRRAPSPALEQAAQTCTRPPYRFILILDFDGVLSPGNSGTLRDAPRLEELLWRFPGVQVVLSTNWREREDLRSLRGWLPHALASRVIGLTPVLADGGQAGGRQLECEDWLRHNPTLQWLALDDTAALFKPGCPWLFLTDNRCALDAPTLAALGERLTRMGAHLLPAPLSEAGALV